MSDWVRNTKDRFCHNAAHIFYFQGLLAQTPPTYPLSQTAIDRIAHNMRVYVDVVENRKDGNEYSHTVHIILGNHEYEPIPCCDWVLYFHSFFILFPGDTANDFPQTNEKVLTDERVIVRMIQGDLYSVEPIFGFGDIGKGQWKYITLKKKYWSVSVSDFMPNWYISQKTEVSGIWPEIVSDTRNLTFVRPFYYPQQYKRYPQDMYDPVSPEVRHLRLGTPDKRQSPPPKEVIPTPVRIFVDKSGPKKYLKIDETWRIRITPTTNKAIAKYLSGLLIYIPVAMKQTMKSHMRTAKKIPDQTYVHLITLQFSL